MTISYNTQDVSAGYFSLLFKWKGSLWKVVWQKLLIFAALYVTISVVVRVGLNEEGKTTFSKVASMFDSFTRRIPITFLLGFYVSQMVQRWWNQFLQISWPDRFMLMISSFFNGVDERKTKIRRTFARYCTLASVLSYRIVSLSVRQRFPTLDHIVHCGLMTEKEKKSFEILEAERDLYNSHYMAPIIWMQNLFVQCRDEGLIDNRALGRLIPEIDTIREKHQQVINFDWVSVPLVYTQVATVATYGYFAFCLIGRQYTGLENLDEKDISVKREMFKQIDIYFPILTLLEFLFYMGWLSVAEQLCNPFGTDDEDFAMTFIINRNHEMGRMITEKMHGHAGELDTDTDWYDLPHTRASYKVNMQEERAQHLENITIPAKDQEIVIFNDSDAVDGSTSEKKNLLSCVKKSSKEHRSYRPVSEAGHQLNTTAETNVPALTD